MLKKRNSNSEHPLEYDLFVTAATTVTRDALRTLFLISAMLPEDSKLAYFTSEYLDTLCRSKDFYMRKAASFYPFFALRKADDLYGLIDEKLDPLSSDPDEKYALFDAMFEVISDDMLEEDDPDLIIRHVDFMEGLDVPEVLDLRPFAELVSKYYDELQHAIYVRFKDEYDEFEPQPLFDPLLEISSVYYMLKDHFLKDPFFKENDHFII